MLVALECLLVIVACTLAVTVSGSPAQTAVVGQGFTVTPADLSFILKQIKIAEAHVATATPGNPCGTLLGAGPDQIANPVLSLGLRTVDGTCNRLGAGEEKFGASDQVFPRLTTPVFSDAESAPPAFGGGATSYNTHTNGSIVFDSEPRTVSNLIVDQTSNNPAAVAAAGPAAQKCTTLPTAGSPGIPAGCEFETLSIPNITTDFGLSPPFNGLFTIFGQFFDHGLDKIANGGNGFVFVPLKADDPLIPGPDHILVDDLGTAVDEAADNLPPSKQFMILTRGSLDANLDAKNSDTPFVDQSQTYTSHPTHQVFTREYANNTAGRPVATGQFLSSNAPSSLTPGNATHAAGLPTWDQVKTQAANLLGLLLTDADIANMPMIAADPYGKFIPGPAHGLPQYVVGNTLIEGNTIVPVPVPAGVTRIQTAFMNDIAHLANPNSSTGALLQPDDDAGTGPAPTPLSVGGPPTYDNEFTNQHFICGDGRCNENIALTSVHQVFHSEHDRLVDDIKQTILADTTANTGILTLADWQNLLGAGGWNGERLFQAARFVTEMEYQHLVFEEFARKVQPAINPFAGITADPTAADAAITAEFAHAVYRFGHSMLTENIARTDAGTGVKSDIPLLDGFLNPGVYLGGRDATDAGYRAAAGSILMGMSDQVGNEIDEFVTDTLRNRLLGLPLDLPTINMTRARSEGIGSLNNVRRQIFAQTNDSALAPYGSWIDFADALKHPASLVNFIAAYGTHPTISAPPNTLASRRAAAQAIVDGVTTGSADFMYGTSLVQNWASVGGVTTTGVDEIDLWMGGLAERTNLFGGMLGSTFNYVFEKQLTNLQNVDRFYYLERAKGMNLLAQLEGNSFSELVMRNTTAHTLKADAFATADCKFQLANLTLPLGPGSVNDDPASECNENLLLQRMPNGEIRYRVSNTVDISPRNAQGVYNGTAGADRIRGGVDNDTFWGGDGNDIIEGQDGADIALGGLGNDIITDSAGNDVHKGGPGNDAINAGPGLDIIMAGDGKDFTDGSGGLNETIAGAGDDFAIGGVGTDSVLGDSGNDWEEGGNDPDLLIGDSNSIFFEDHNLPGHDILIGQNGDDKYFGEGGDDIVVAGPGFETSDGAAGFDWMTGSADPQAQNNDLNNAIIGAALTDKFKEVEGLSGGNANDILSGDDVVPTNVNPLTAPGGVVGCDALDEAGVNRIAGLAALVPATLRTVPSGPIILASATHHCLLTGNVWGAGNIILGGPGSDTLDGGGANDIIDGDKLLKVRLSVRADPLAPLSETGTTELMERPLTGFNTYGGLTLQQAVFAGLVDPGNIVAVREILSPTTPAADCGALLPLNCDTALFSDVRSRYTVTVNADGSVTVLHRTTAGVPGFDGTDTLRNVEQVRFCAATPAVRGQCLVQAAPVPLVPAGPVPPVVGPVVALSGATDFGIRRVGTSTTRVVTVTNTGTSALLISSVTPTPTGTPFRVTLGTCGINVSVAAGGNCTLNAIFAPTAVGLVTGVLTVNSNASNSPTSKALSGTGR